MRQGSCQEDTSVIPGEAASAGEQLGWRLSDLSGAGAAGADLSPGESEGPGRRCPASHGHHHSPFPSSLILSPLSSSPCPFLLKLHQSG